MFGFLTSSSATRLYRGRVPRLTSDNFTCCHTRDRAGRPRLLSEGSGPPGTTGDESSNSHMLNLIKKKRSCRLCIHTATVLCSHLLHPSACMACFLRSKIYRRFYNYVKITQLLIFAFTVHLAD